MTKRFDNEVIMVFGDSHFPYHHKDTFKFLQHIATTYCPDRIVHLGDLLDIYSVSDYPKDINHKDTWKDEIKKARECVQKLAELFPVMDILQSNHDDRIYKKSRVAGIPREAMAKYEDIIGAPPGWKWHPYLRITVDSTREQLYFAHTLAGGSLRAAQDLGCTCILGHSHSKFGATAFSPAKGKMIWGVDAGCLVSDKGAPYSYNKLDRGRPIRGCCVIGAGVPHLIPFGSVYFGS